MDLNLTPARGHQRSTVVPQTTPSIQTINKDGSTLPGFGGALHIMILHDYTAPYKVEVVEGPRSGQIVFLDRQDNSTEIKFEEITEGSVSFNDTDSIITIDLRGQFDKTHQ